MVRIATNTKKNHSTHRAHLCQVQYTKFEDVIEKLCYRCTRNALPPGLDNLIQRNLDRNSTRMPKLLHEPSAKKNQLGKLPANVLYYEPKICNTTPDTIRNVKSINVFNFF